jgi:hypothetical protein
MLQAVMATASAVRSLPSSRAISHDPASVDRVDPDPHAAPQHRHHAVALRSLGEDGFAGVVAAHPDAGEQELSLFGSEPAEKPALAEEPACVLGEAISGFVFQCARPGAPGSKMISIAYVNPGGCRRY